MFDPLAVIGIADAYDIPTVRHESGLNIFRERNARVAFDGDVVVVVNPAEIIESEMSGKGGGFRCNAFHEAAVAADGVDVVVENLKAWPIVMTREPFLGNCHSNACCRALP